MLQAVQEFKGPAKLSPNFLEHAEKRSGLHGSLVIPPQPRLYFFLVTMSKTLNPGNA